MFLCNICLHIKIYWPGEIPKGTERYQTSKQCKHQQENSKKKDGNMVRKEMPAPTVDSKFIRSFLCCHYSE